MNQPSCVYILEQLQSLKKIYQHEEGVCDSFTKKYKVHLLVYYETYNDIKVAIKREKQLKSWNREWKIKLIEKENSCWMDLYNSLF